MEFQPRLLSDETSISFRGSKNGTFVNGEAIFGITLLKPHDILKIGPMEFEVAAPVPPPQPVEAIESAGESTIHHESDTAVDGKESPPKTLTRKKIKPGSTARSISDPKTDPAKKKKYKSKKATEESIISWLDEDHQAATPQVHETTIITQEEIASDPQMAALDSVHDAEPVIVPAKKKKKRPAIDPTVQQASDIIRRFWIRKRNG